MNPYINQVAKSVPFDKTDTEFTSDDTQLAIEECVRKAKARWSTVIPFSTVTTISTNGNLYITNDSSSLHWLQGTGSNFHIHLPISSSIEVNFKLEVWNMTDFVVLVYDGSGNLLFELGQQSYALIQLEKNSTPAGTWRYWQILASSVASGIINYKVTNDTQFSSSSLTDVLLPNTSIIPQAGTYGVWFNTEVRISQNNQRFRCSIYKDNTQIADSERTVQGVSSNFDAIAETLTVVQVNGLETISARARITSGSFTVEGRTLLLIRLGT